MEALRQARARSMKRFKQKPEPGMGTNEAGPPPETNPPPNGWPQDGDYSA
jgi:hypothetical protein